MNLLLYNNMGNGCLLSAFWFQSVLFRFFTNQARMRLFELKNLACFCVFNFYFVRYVSVEKSFEHVEDGRKMFMLFSLNSKYSNFCSVKFSTFLILFSLSQFYATARSRFTRPIRTNSFQSIMQKEACYQLHRSK